MSLASSQWQHSEVGPCALNYGPIIEMARAMNITVDEVFFTKISAYESEVLAVFKEKMDENIRKRRRGGKQ